jgi:spore germination cell wall hydrolase CwlJ-like protein
MAEAASQGQDGMTAVGEVISTRSVDKSKTPLEVVTSRSGKIHAFSCLNGTTAEALVRRQQEEPNYAQALKIAAVVCRAPGRLPGLTRGATHFTLVNERPRWARNKKPVAIVRNHAFYRLARY